jgi:hypothetical protein
LPPNCHSYNYNEHQDKGNQYKAWRFDAHGHHLYLRVSKKKKKNIVVVATETINVAQGYVARFKKIIKNGIFKLHFQK